MLCVNSDFGTTNAEIEYQTVQAVQLDRYYSSFASDTTILASEFPQYSGWFNALTARCSNIFIGIDFISLRHVFNALLAVIGIIFAGLLAKRCAGLSAGIFTVVLLGLSPIFFANVAFNLQDIPTASCFIASIFFLKRLADYFPKPKIIDAVLFTIFTALSLSAMPETAIILPLSLVAIAFLLIVKRNDKPVKSASIRYSIFFIAAIFFIGFLVHLLVPALWQSPFNFGKWFATTSTPIFSRILFEGNLYWTDLLPWYYNAKMLLITIPIALIIGILLGIGICFWKKICRSEITFLVIISILSIVIFSLRNDTNGMWQHLLFAIFPLYVVAGTGFAMLVKLANKKSLKLACNILPIIIMLMPAVHIIRNHPFEHIYFNEFVGGTSSAYGKYELENLGLSNKQASKWIIDNGKYQLSGNQLFIANTSEQVGKYYFNEYKTEVSVVKTNYAERSNHIWDYAIFPLTGIEPELLKNEFFPPKNAVETIKVDDIPICLILQRLDTCDLYGRGYLAGNDLMKAVGLLETSVANDNTNESAIMNLIVASMQLNDKPAMKNWIDKYLALSPKSDVGNYFLALHSNITGDKEKAMSICEQVIERNPRFIEAYLLLSTMNIQVGNFAEAEQVVLSLVDYDVYTEEAARQLARVYNAQKRDIREAEQAYYNYAYKSYKKRGKNELARKYEKLLK